MPTPQENKELLRRHFEALKEQNWDRCANTVSKDIAFHQSGETHHGVDWLIAHYQDFYDTFPDAKITVDALLADDDRVAARITNHGTPEGEIPGVESTGTEIEFLSHFIARVEDDTIEELWVVAEPLRLNQQLGTVKPASE